MPHGKGISRLYFVLHVKIKEETRIMEGNTELPELY
jgi:hypothetical protein